MLVKSFGRINDLFSLTNVQCMCKQKLSRILVVQVSWTALQPQFMEQYFSISQFTDTRNGRSRRHKNKSPPPLSSPPYTNPLHQPISNWNAAETTWFISSALCIFNHSLRFLRWRKKILRTHEWRKGKGATAAETLAFNLRLQCDSAASTDKKMIESRSSNDMKPTIDPNGKITLCILVMLACATDETKLW